jgi:hypothetical protein
MSIDPDWVVDEGPDPDGEDPGYDDGDFDDNDYGPPKEEPDCYTCHDNGCRDCIPTRFQVWRWQLRRRLRFRYRWRVRRRNRAHRRRPDEPPF